MLGPPVLAGFRIILREDLWRRGFVVEFEHVRWCNEFWCARVRARRREERCRARSSAEGGSPKIKNFMKKKMRRAMDSWPRRKPWVNERLVGSEGFLQEHRRGVGGLTRSLGRQAGSEGRAVAPFRLTVHIGGSVACGHVVRRLLVP